MGESVDGGWGRVMIQVERGSIIDRSSNPGKETQQQQQQGRR